MSQCQNLIAQDIPLTGKHLIEASAGTGKTFNITRIYLRMLLERELTVEQILVMTFTKDATQELKGRIDSVLRDSLHNWQKLITTDPFYQALATKVSASKAQILLKQALLFLDEAAIYTIHGFCQRILNEHAFGTGAGFEISLETDVSELVEQACQDWYRLIATDNREQFLQLAEYWATPNAFLNAFTKAIFYQGELNVLSVSYTQQSLLTGVQTAISSLQSEESLIELVLIDSQKGEKQQLRRDELSGLTAWLTALAHQLTQSMADHDDNIELLVQNCGKMPTSFYHGTRYARSPHKSALLAAFEPLKILKKSYDSLVKDVNKAKAYQVALLGIYQIRENFSATKALRQVIGFDDLIKNVATALTENSSLAQVVARDFPVALVDEFQDTDPQQFAILQAMYPTVSPDPTNNKTTGNEATAVFMIGDPKQAIYGFRGGDVFAYLAAREQCQYQWLMDTNWRSSIDMVNGYNRLFHGNVLTETSSDVFGFNIPYQTVKASPNAKPELASSDEYQALQFIHFEGNETQEKVPQSFRIHMAHWCANEISRLLRANQQMKLQDIAILVRDGSEASEIKLALSEQNLSAVYLSERSDLFQSEQAQQLLTLFQGVLFCDNERIFTRALASPLLGLSPVDYYQLQQNEQAWHQIRLDFEQLRQQWLNRGFMSMALKLLHEHCHIHTASLDRVLTNVLHLFELLQMASQQHHQPDELLFWLAQHIEGQARLTETELRLESDDDLIKIVTQHGSKGLEYPVVFVPFASRYKNPLRIGNKAVNLIEYHDDAKKLHLSLDGSTLAKQRMVAENHAETIRLLYVAITRAEQRCYLLSCNFADADKSPLGLTLQLAEQDLASKLTQLAQPNSGIGFKNVTLNETDTTLSETTNSTEAAASNTPTEKPAFSVARFTGHIERDWWLSSFSALTRNNRHMGVSAPERDAETLMPANNDIYHHLLRFQFKKGAQTGNFLHDLFELTDFSSPNWLEGIAILRFKYSTLLENVDVTDLIDWLNDIVQTPMSASLSLASLTQENTLREAEFYFPMAQANINKLTQLVVAHRQALIQQYQLTGLVSSYVHLPNYRQLKGMMHGFIDLIFQADGKYYLCDYKSSHLGEHYRYYQDAQLAQHVIAHDYDLQYLIYALALHRYLKVQLPDYQPSRDFGGVYYLYLRGMTKISPIEQQSGYGGVYANTLSVTLLEELDAIFSGEDIECSSFAQQTPNQENAGTDK